MFAADPFATLGVEPCFRIDEAGLRRAWMRRAATAHPDLSGDAETSATVNEAYQALRDPLVRGEALLARLGARQSPDPPLGPELLASMIDFRERLDDASGRADGIGALRVEAQAEFSGALEAIARAFDEIGDPPVDARHASQVRALLAVARSWRRVLESVDAAAEAARSP